MDIAMSHYDINEEYRRPETRKSISNFKELVYLIELNVLVDPDKLLLSSDSYLMMTLLSPDTWLGTSGLLDSWKDELEESGEDESWFWYFENSYKLCDVGEENINTILENGKIISKLPIMRKEGEFYICQVYDNDNATKSFRPYTVLVFPKYNYVLVPKKKRFLAITKLN